MSRLEGDARNRILDEAFALFSEGGFAETSMRDIADSLGIKAASLYNHFSGKQELIDALIERETAYVEGQLRDVGAMVAPDDDAAEYAKRTGESLGELVWLSYAPFFEDERVRLFMRMLAMDRYADAGSGNLYKAIYIDRPITIQERIFAKLISEGKFISCDPHVAAEQFHGAMLMHMEMLDDAYDAKAFCLAHTEAFNDLYRKDS